MGKILVRRKAVSKILLRPTVPGHRAVFLVEAQEPRDRQKVRELFAAIGEMADVVQLSDGEMMAYAVQVREEATLFAKIESVLKEEFAFSIVERSFTEITYHLVQSLCEESNSRLRPVPRCGICGEADPFPTRVQMLDDQDRGVIEAHYCSRCAAQQADPSDQKFLTDLLAADRRDFRAIQDARLVPTSTATATDVAAYAIAS
jgi:hypothetical protein